MKIRHSFLPHISTASTATLIAASTLVFQSTPAKAFHPCPPFHRAEHTGPFGSVPVCVPEAPAGNIPTNPRELSEEAWGQAGQAVYRQGGEAMLARASARGSSPRPLDEYQKRYLRPHFGNLVNNVVVFYNVPPLDNWQILGMGVKSHTDAQTFCERIFVNGQYNSTDRNQLALLAHELVHSQQCQRFGGVERFGYEYFKAYKRANLNYANISLEQEAYAFEARFKEWLNAQLNPSSATVAMGFYRQQDRPEVYLVYRSGFYCHVQNEDQMNAFGGFGRVQVISRLSLSGTNTGDCGWSNGFFRRSNKPEVYRMYGNGIPEFNIGDSFCHVANEAQMNAYGGFGQVRVVSPSSDLGRGRRFTGKCPNP